MSLQSDPGILCRSAVLRATCAVALLSFALAGCDEDPPEVAVIEKTRVLAARVEVEGEPSRASPLPGENVSVTLLAVTPEPEPALAFSLTACVATNSVSTLVGCEGEPLARAASLEPVTAAPAIVFRAPDVPGESGRLAVVGALCPAGVALPSEDAGACADGSWLLGVTADFPMDDGSAPNTNPAFVAYTFDGTELGAETASEADCALLVSVPSGSKGHALRVELDPSSRDPLPVEASSDTARESLLISWYTTRGELDHAYSSIDSTAPESFATAAWDAPSVAEPTLARFFAVVRDGRGGSDFLERRVCIVP